MNDTTNDCENSFEKVEVSMNWKFKWYKTRYDINLQKYIFVVQQWGIYIEEKNPKHTKTQNLNEIVN